MRILPVLLFLATVYHSVAAEKPNVLVILTDDQGWGDLSGSGNTNLSTPNLDRLAADGASFDRFFVCPVCSPTRAEFLTGRHHARGGVYSTSAGGERLDLDELTIADAFKAAGYATGAFGKWHNGMQFPYHPNGRGFDEFYGFCSGHWGNYYSPMLEHNGKLVKGDGFVVDDFTNRTMAFMEKQHAAKKPFFAYVPYNTPHSPMQVPDRWWKKFKDAQLETPGEKTGAANPKKPGKKSIGHTRAALAMCENIDWNVGRMMEKLDALGIAENTIVVFFCDNGPNGPRWNGGMRGRKGSTDEGGVRSPLFVRWRGKIEAGRAVDRIGSARDLFPTLADLAGIRVKWGKPVDGISLSPLLRDGGAIPWPERELIAHWKGKVSLRTQKFRLDHEGRLYDMVADPGQRKDVADQHPDLAERLRGNVKKWRAEMLVGYGKDDRPFVIAHPGTPLTQVPARDGTAHGGIRRSNRFPNCSFFTNWKSVDDKISWKVEVGKSGKYVVDVYYTCAEKDLGSKVELRLGDAAVSATVDVANDPPLVGAEQDLVPRMESYVKDFKPMRLGEIELQEGAGELVLRALDVPGEAVMDFRLLMLTRVE